LLTLASGHIPCDDVAREIATPITRPGRRVFLLRYYSATGVKMKTYVLVFALIAAAAFSYPASIKCPIDGEYMFFDHKVGYGEDSVCWYAHTHNVFDSHGAHSEKHTAYIPCPDK
jgi:hypothetical protein